ncbi:MAG: hypothetical protein WB706_12905, partial [Nitrososphaeraceae archaeon]
MVTTKTAMGEEQFKLYQEKEYPNPQSIPRPPATYEPKPQVALADLTAKSYVKTVGRAVYLKTTERQDELGSKVIFSGILEDATFKLPFVSHKINVPWQRDTVYKFDNAYVHEFPDRSLLLVIIDSIISLHRAEYSGRGTLWDRQQKLNSMLHRLTRLAEVYNIA